MTSHSSVGSLGSARQCLLSVSHAVAVRCWLGLELSEGSTEVDVQDGTLTWLTVGVSWALS